MMLNSPIENEQHYYPETTGIMPALERYWRRFQALGASGSCPAGLMAEVGLRWCGAKLPNRTKRRIPMNATANKSTTVSAVADTLSIKPAAKPVSKAKTAGANSNSKQSRVVAMLQSPSGTTIAKMMKTTGWQQHSVRGFLAGVVRKRLKLKLTSKKMASDRVYLIAGTTSAANSRRSSKARSR
jgi:hypothetical protein